MHSIPVSAARFVKNAIIGAVCRFLGAFFHTRGPIDLAEIQAAAIIKPCCLGDVLMSTPALGAIRRALPSARIDYFVGSWSRSALEGNSHVDNIVDCGSLGAGAYGLGEYLTVASRLRQGHYDACFVLERSALLTLLPLLAGIPHRIGLDSEGRGFSLTNRAPVLGVKHEVERYLDVVRAAGIQPPPGHLEFHPMETAGSRVDDLLAKLGLPEAVSGDKAGPDRLGDNTSQTAPFIAIHPAGGANPGMELSAKRWPAERFAAIADRVIERYGAQVLIVGAESDLPLAREMERAMKHRGIDLVGKLSFTELGAALARCQLFLGNDTGPMHLAVAVGVPVVAIFGPTDERVYGPYSDNASVVASAVPCRPCFIKGAARPCRTNDCILSVGVEDVWQAVQTRLGATRSDKPGAVPV